MNSYILGIPTGKSISIENIVQYSNNQDAAQSCSHHLQVYGATSLEAAKESFYSNIDLDSEIVTALYKKSLHPTKATLPDPNDWYVNELLAPKSTNDFAVLPYPDTITRPPYIVRHNIPSLQDLEDTTNRYLLYSDPKPTSNLQYAQELAKQANEIVKDLETIEHMTKSIVCDNIPESFIVVTENLNNRILSNLSEAKAMIDTLITKICYNE